LSSIGGLDLVTETLSRESAETVAYFEHKIKFEIGPNELKMKQEKGEKFQIIDLRTVEHFAKGHIPGARNVLLENLDAHLSTLDRETTTVVYCYDKLCHLSAIAALQVAKKGYRVRELDGGFDGWAGREFEVEGQKNAGTCSSSCT
jgi:rhodanese-related sulfurtransferase